MSFKQITKTASAKTLKLCIIQTTSVCLQTINLTCLHLNLILQQLKSLITTDRVSSVR